MATLLTDEQIELGEAGIAAQQGPVVITHEGKPSHVLISFDTFSRLDPVEAARAGGGRDFEGMSLAEALAGGPEHDFDWDPPRMVFNPQPIDCE